MAITSKGRDQILSAEDISIDVVVKEMLSKKNRKMRKISTKLDSG